MHACTHCRRNVRRAAHVQAYVHVDQPLCESLLCPPPAHTYTHIYTAEEMLGYLTKGADNRHTGETRLNHESSRSHSVFTCVVEKTVTSDGVSKIFFAKIHLIDLAGAYRPWLKWGAGERDGACCEPQTAAWACMHFHAGKARRMAVPCW